MSKSNPNILGVIPARYASSRFPGKALADICGRPMIWWVYKQAVKVKELCRVIVATDDEKIMSVCEEYGMDAVLTSSDHKTHVDRVYEVSLKIDADLYVCVCGDEPLTKPETMALVVPPPLSPSGFGLYYANVNARV